MCCNIQNAYLQVPSSREHHIVCGPAFGFENVGDAALLYQALYGGMMAGLDFCIHFRPCMHHLVFSLALMIPVFGCALIRAVMVLSFMHTSFCTWVTILHLVNLLKVIWHELGNHFPLQEPSIGPLNLYIDGHVGQAQLIMVSIVGPLPPHGLYR